MGYSSLTANEPSETEKHAYYNVSDEQLSLKRIIAPGDISVKNKTKKIFDSLIL